MIVSNPRLGGRKNFLMCRKTSRTKLNRRKLDLDLRRTEAAGAVFPVVESGVDLINNLNHFWRYDPLWATASLKTFLQTSLYWRKASSSSLPIFSHAPPFQKYFSIYTLLFKSDFWFGNLFICPRHSNCVYGTLIINTLIFCKLKYVNVKLCCFYVLCFLVLRYWSEDNGLSAET